MPTVRDDEDRLPFAKKNAWRVGFARPSLRGEQKTLQGNAAVSLTTLKPNCQKNLTTTGDAQAKTAVQASALDTDNQRKYVGF
ncbi:hypothetical protein JNA64_00075 [Pseudomonas stutzeri]|uniref:hypothetical protein n=1 Tax=Stutzerimonas stutzeri TaxID=316 RepID=UPI001F51BDB8|nr:hypothetical protein [Stutzerimonas stutzeri]MCI0915558.1 hypothetical protein [Stutzerimonas stutzeri]